MNGAGRIFNDATDHFASTWNKDLVEETLERTRTPCPTNHDFEDAQLKCVPDF